MAHSSERNGLKAPGFAAGCEPHLVRHQSRCLANARTPMSGKPVTPKRPIASIREANALAHFGAQKFTKPVKCGISSNDSIWLLLEPAFDSQQPPRRVQRWLWLLLPSRFRDARLIRAVGSAASLKRFHDSWARSLPKNHPLPAMLAAVTPLSGGRVLGGMRLPLGSATGEWVASADANREVAGSSTRHAAAGWQRRRQTPPQYS